MTSVRWQGIFNHYHWLITRIQRLLDGLVVVLLLAFFCWLYGVKFTEDYYILSGVTFILVWVVFQAAQLYQPWRGANLIRLMKKVTLTWVVVAAILLAAGFLFKESATFSRGAVIPWMLTAPLALVLLRLQVYLALRWARAYGRNTRTAVIAGAGELGRRLAGNILETPWLGMRFFGFFDDAEVGENIEIPSQKELYPVLGNLDDMAAFIQKNRVDMVYLALPLRAEGRIREVVEAIQDTTASVYFVPDVFTFSLLRANLVTDLRGIPLISLWESPFYGVDGWLKRSEDVVLATLILILISPLMALIALGIKLTSHGPVIFKQRRYGLGGREIMVYKFRTMTVLEDGLEVPQATQNDSRVTRFGRFLRRTSLDELPQFFNALKGNMSIVGPRPHAVAHNEHYRHLIPGYMLRHKVRPGITGWAQVNGWRGETETLEKMEKRIEFDLEYLHNWSLWLDLKIIFLTIFRGLRDTRAY